MERVSFESLHGAQIAHEHTVATRQERVAFVAYLKAEARGFEVGYEVEDWITAQLAVDAHDFSSYRQW